ncbi:MAG: cytochrome c-type biogenesis protein CcmH [Halioglobus sp.]|nr:cytochrome c-type biogenesis protein CcmH [Halioglobus sp.]
MSALRLLLFAVVFLHAGFSLALIETYEFRSPELEARYQMLSEELRCPKCQNQTIEDSNAPIAQDLRKLLHQQLEQGASDEEVLEYMVARYGEFVRYRPRFGGTTLLLWMAPVLLLLAGIGLLMLTLRPPSRASHKKPTELSAEEQARLATLLAQDETGDNS